MKMRSRWFYGTVIAGLVLMVLGAVDPLEGSLVILAGSALVAVGALLCHSRSQRVAWWALGLTSTGVALMIVLSQLGGLGGSRGVSVWWGLLLLPYPIGWLLGIAAATRTLLRARHP
ncbi:MAG: hypothetical protein K1X53_13000 [Candidatus Sumerlaeaceae bacterium]|nr:hypothetical protein [Candidatus Sumerlaeaceae bacterium]